MALQTLIFLFFSAVVVALVTRVQTGLQSRRQSACKDGPKEIAVLPYWIPWLGHAPQFLTRFQHFLADAKKSTKDGVFHIVLAGTRHNIVIQPSVTRQIFQQRNNVSARDLAYHILENCFGNKGGIRAMDPAICFGKLHDILWQLGREPFVSHAAAATVRSVERLTHNLISFSPSWVDQSIWEREAHTTVIDASGTVAETEFFALIRYFVGDTACTVLMGQDFMTNNPQLLSDLYTFDRSFTKLLAGFPWWMPGMGPAFKARDRLVEAMREHQDALRAVFDDRDPGSKWNDMSDVSNVMQARAREWVAINATPNDYAPGDAIILWAMNINANQVIFWLLLYIYQNPTLRQEILDEIAPYANLTPVKSDLPIKEAPKLSINLEGLVSSCPLLKSAFYETLRLEAPGTSYKSVLETFHVTESAEDAALDGKSVPQTYRFDRGTFLCIPHGVHSKDGRYWKDPESFNPRRFFVKDEKDGSIKVDAGTMKVFGGGANMCKGKAFAEREVLIFVAAILVAWDVEPVGGKWPDLGRIAGSGAFLPKRELRVRMRRRLVK